MFRALLALFSAAILATACSSVDPYAPVTADSDVGGIVYKPVGEPGFRLEIGRYKGEGKRLGMPAIANSDEFKFLGRDYRMAKVEPGTYVVKLYTSQTYWNVCFFEDTLAFEVKPGEIVYLGEIETTPYLIDLQRKALMNGDISATVIQYQYTTSKSDYMYFDDVIPPQFSGNDDETALSEISSLTSKSLQPKAVESQKANVVPAEFTEASFGRGVILDKFRKSCG